MAAGFFSWWRAWLVVIGCLPRRTCGSGCCSTEDKKPPKIHGWVSDRPGLVGGPCGLFLILDLVWFIAPAVRLQLPARTRFPRRALPSRLGGRKDNCYLGQLESRRRRKRGWDQGHLWHCCMATRNTLASTLAAAVATAAVRVAQPWRAVLWPRVWGVRHIVSVCVVVCGGSGGGRPVGRSLRGVERWVTCLINP